MDEDAETVMFIDIEAVRPLTDDPVHTVYVEVKCFSEVVLDATYLAIGQYLAYQAILTKQGNPNLLYLAVPTAIYQQSSLLRLMVDRHQINTITVDLAKQEITQWITWP